MAYGKDANLIDQTTSFRQTVAAHQQQRPRSEGRGGFRFVDEFRPNIDIPDTIRIVKGLYDVELADQNGVVTNQKLYYYPFVEHFHGTLKKGAICSAGPLHAFKALRQPCHGCDIFWAQRESGQKRGPMSKSERYAVTVLHFHPYAKVEQIDNRTGQIRTSQDGKPYMEWVAFQPHERAKFANRELRDWNLMHWAMGYGHWNTLYEYDEQIGMSCKSCGAMNSIVSVAWTCQQCGDAVIDMSTSTLDPKQLKDITTKRCRCPHCGFEGFLKEWVQCNNCANGMRADIFDVNLQVKRIKPNDDSNQNQLGIMGWSAPGPIDPRYAEFAKPLDLAKIYSPDNLERQARQWGLGAAPQQQPPGPQYRPFQNAPQMPQPVPPMYQPPVGGQMLPQQPMAPMMPQMQPPMQAPVPVAPPMVQPPAVPAGPQPGQPFYGFPFGTPPGYPQQK